MRGALIILLIFASTSSKAADWYVDGLNGSDDNIGSLSSPFQHPWRAIGAAAPGDTVHLMPTIVYSAIGVYGKSGTSAAPITIQGEGTWPNLTQVNGGGTNFGIQANVDTAGVPSSYLVFKRFDVQAPGPWYGMFVGSKCHHIVIMANHVHDSGNGGVGTVHADYLTISGNWIYGNAQFTLNGIFGSGISMWENTDVDNYTGTKVYVTGNVVYNNSNASQGSIAALDGNGIIVDDSRHSETDQMAYGGRTRIANNLVFGNGGRGIDSYSSDHVYVVNNTLYENNNDPNESYWRPGEISVGHSGDANVYNNIVYSTGAYGSNTGSRTGITVENGSGAPTAVDYNLIFNMSGQSNQYFLGGSGGHKNGNVVTIGPNNLWGDPLFVRAPGNLLLSPGSVGLLNALTSVAPPVDFNGTPRNPQGPTDMGAYQQD